MKHYFIENSQADDRYDKLVAFLLEYCDAVEFTPDKNNKVYTFKPSLLKFRLFERVKVDDSLLAKTLSNLQEDLITTSEDNILFNVPQKREDSFAHYRYRLSPRLKEILSKEGLFFDSLMNSESTRLYGLSYPVFYRNGRMVAFVQSPSIEVMLHLEDDELALLEEKTAMNWAQFRVKT